MLGPFIRHLVDLELTSVQEVQKITGRGATTVYRWMKGESEPSCGDMRHMVREISDPEGRRVLLALLTSDLPVHINWHGDECKLAVEHSSGDKRVGAEALDYSLLALDCLANILAQQRDAMQEGTISVDSYHQLVVMIDDIIKYMTTSKNMLRALLPPSAKARKRNA